MHVTRIEAAPEYQAPNHIDMQCLRLQGLEATPSRQLWMGLSRILPGGRTGLDASPLEKLYFLVEGELHVIGERDGQRQEQVLHPHDSCLFAPGEKRQLVNRSERPAAVLLVMPMRASDPHSSLQE